VKIPEQNWRFLRVGRTVMESMHHPGVGSSVARAVPGPGIELGPQLGAKRGSPADGAAWAGVIIAAISVAAGIVVAGDPGHSALDAFSAIVLGAGATALGISSQRRRTAGVLDKERQRIARNLHDGLAQELAYIRMETQRMAAVERNGRVDRLAQAAERALEESRSAIEALHSGGDDPFHLELSELADELASRQGARLSVQVDPAIQLKGRDREALLRIMREAISNGVSHGRATEVALELTGDDGVRMAVRDNGAGFAPGGPRRRGGFGLASMRARAQELGGDLKVQSAPGQGTVVEVKLP
jgi:signal transduction histidine kinase